MEDGGSYQTKLNMRDNGDLKSGTGRILTVKTFTLGPAKSALFSFEELFVEFACI
jgi:hypothetical protein